MFFDRSLIGFTVLFIGINSVLCSNKIKESNFMTNSIPASLHKADSNARNNLMNFIREEGRRLEDNDAADDDAAKDDGNDNNDDGNQEAAREYYRENVDWSNIGFDVTGMSLKYNGCSAIQTFNDEYAANGYASPLSTKRFAVFRLCPQESCSYKSSMGCSKNFGEYILELDIFLQGLVEYNNEKKWQSCNFCAQCNALESFGAAMETIESDNNANRRRLDDNANNDNNEEDNNEDEEDNTGIEDMWDDNWNEEWLNTDWRYLPYCSSKDLSFCSSAESSCENYEANEDRPSIEKFTQCVAAGNGYYVGPQCASDSYTITLGVYSDSNCDSRVESKTVESVLGYSISDSFAYPTDCYSCEQRSRELLYNNYLEQGEDNDYGEWLQENFEEYMNNNADDDNSNNNNDDNDGSKVGYYYNRQQLYSEGSDGVTGFYSKSYQFANDDDQEYGQYAQYGIANICGNLYELSAKCNRNMGNSQDLISSYTSEQQLEDEDLVCIFAENVRRKRYSEEGSVVLDGTRYVSEINWMNSEEVTSAYKSVGISSSHLAFLLASIVGCALMFVWAFCLHRTLVTKNIPWRPKRGLYGYATDVETQYSGILLGRSTTNTTRKEHDDKRTTLL